MNTWTQQEINDCIKHCKERASSDNAFRELLLNDPETAVRQVSGKDLPVGFRLKIIEANPHYDATFVLPPLASSEVSDENLDHVAAGSGICIMNVCAAEACAADK